MFTKKWFSALITCVCLIAVIAAFGGGVFAALVAESAALVKAAAYFIAVAAVLSLLYLLLEFGKEGAIYFTLFKAAACVGTAFAVIADGLSDVGAYTVVADTVGLMLVVFLAVGKDLGRTVSLVAAGVLAVLFAVGFALCAVETPGVLAGDAPETSDAIFTAIAKFGLALTVAAMTVEKYIDKAKRGAK